MELLVVATLAIVFYFGYLTVQDLIDDCRREGLLPEDRFCGDGTRAGSSRLAVFLKGGKVLSGSLRVAAPWIGTAALVRVIQPPITGRLSRNCWR